jgi:hypothetical protein
MATVFPQRHLRRIVIAPAIGNLVSIICGMKK